MNRLALILVIAALIVAAPPVHSRSGPDDALGLDPTRIDEIVSLVEPLDARMARYVGRGLTSLSVDHGFRIRKVQLGPVPGYVMHDDRVDYHPYLHITGTSGGGSTDRETGKRTVHRYQIENPVVASIDLIEEGRKETGDPAWPTSRYIVKIIRLTYDFVVAVDDDTSDGTSWKISLPMDVTVRGEATHGPREGDGCKGWWGEFRLLEASYGPLQMITVRSD